MIRAFYSDPHLGHHNIIAYCNRPFETLEHMHDELVRRYNVVVGPDDVVVWCGDAVLGRFEEAASVLRRMHGHKILVRGNHDGSAAKMARLGFALVTDELTLQLAGHPCRVHHFPYAGATADERYHELRPKKRPGEILIHGHTHEKTRRTGNRIHVGVDAWAYAPALFSEVEKLAMEIT